MKFYFIRHGESVGNELGVQQFDNIQLTELGKIQAFAVGKYLKTKDIDALLSSELYRARETADIIAKLVGHEAQIINGLRELKHPTSMQGMRYDDKQVLEMKKQLYTMADDPAFHIEDGENFIEFQKRCTDILNYLTTRQEKVLAIVTHGYVIRMFVMLTMLRQNVKPNFIEEMRTSWKISHGSVTKLDYTDDQWLLRGFNDTAHLNQLPTSSDH